MRPPRSAAAAAIATCLASLLLGGCLTGSRPTLADEPLTTGDPAVDLLVNALDSGPQGAFTAEYTITNNYGPIIRPATVAHSDDERRSVTIGDVRFLFGAGPISTCSPSGANSFDCVDTVNDAAVSDLQVTHQFYDRSASMRLLADTSRRIGPLDTYTAVIANHEVDCLSIPVSGGTKVYCVSPLGILASYQGPDVLIEMTSLSNEADERLFVPHS
jgi:hypothetical protein